ncbi:hypothetical protein ALC57_13832, partial [Trachymyrmex cornetzi]
FQKEACSRPKVYGTKDGIKFSSNIIVSRLISTTVVEGPLKVSLTHDIMLTSCFMDVNGVLKNQYNRSRKTGPFSAPKLNFPDTKAKVPKHLDGTSGTELFAFVSTLTRLNITPQAIPHEFLAVHTSTLYYHCDNFINPRYVLALMEAITIATSLIRD